MRSDLHELIHKCAMPVPVRTGAKTGPDGQPLPLILGPNTAVDLDTEGGEFGLQNLLAEVSSATKQRFVMLKS